MAVFFFLPSGSMSQWLLLFRKNKNGAPAFTGAPQFQQALSYALRFTVHRLRFTARRARRADEVSYSSTRRLTIRFRSTGFGGSISTFTETCDRFRSTPRTTVFFSVTARSFSRKSEVVLTRSPLT